LGLDLNNDGVTDFTIENVLSSCSTYDHRMGVGPECSPHQYEALFAQPEGPNLVLDDASSFASALTAGKKIGAQDNFGVNARMEACSTQNGFLTDTLGPWRGTVTNHYLGLQFFIDGQAHYGWARLSTTRKQSTNCVTITVLSGYAYETIANRAIPAGKTSGTDGATGSLGTLAKGAPGQKP
jgi:hypothetical protein